MSVEFPKLPYSLDALEPYMSRRALDYHYNILHRRYVEKTNALAEGTKWAKCDLTEIVKSVSASRAIYKPAAQAWAHDFFWHSMRPPTGSEGVPHGPLSQIIKRDFGSLLKLRDAIVEAALGIFGSGWVWLVMRGRKLVVESTPNTGNPMRKQNGQKTRGHPVLVVDVWEHAYYLNYGPDREDFVITWFDLLANWGFASEMTLPALTK